MPHTAPLGGRSLQRYILLMIVGLATCNANIISILKKTDAPVTEDDPSTRTAKEVHAEARLPFTISSATLLDDGAAVPILRNEDDVIGSKRADRIQMGLQNLLRPINLPTEKRTQGPYSSAREESAEELLETATEPTQNVTVMISGGFNAVLKKLIPQFYAKSGYVITLVSGPSMGQSAEAIPNRLARGEKADVVIMVGDALKSLEKDNWTQPGSRTELADSSIGMVVKAGDPWPDIRTVSALRNTLLEAKSIAYSDSASGTYIGSKMFKKLGIEDQVKDKAHMIAVVPVASEVAKGNYALGFQQVSELLPVPGVELVGELPDEVQLITRYAGAVIAKAENQAGGKELLNFLSSPQVQDTIHAAGLRSVSTENSGNGCKSSYALNLLIILLALFTILHKECM